MKHRFLGLLGLIYLTLGANACSLFVQLPTTPRLMNLTEPSVFSLAPPPEWPTPQPDNPAQAAVDVACGVGPLPTNGSLYAAVSVQGRQPAAELAPLNLALVLDRSGSMSGAPFRNMLIAAETFVSQLRDGDRVSILAFSDGVFEAVPSVVMDPNTRNLTIAAIHALGNGGGTYLSGGMLAGLFEVFSFFQPWQVNQLVLFSDGQPNRGITSAEELMRIAGRAAEHGVSVTTIGFGQDHDELLMQGIADASGGYYYYVDKPEDMAAIFQREAGSILRSAARATEVAFTLPAGAVLEDVLGYDYYMSGNSVWVRLGSVPHGESRYMVVKMRSAPSSQLPFNIVYGDMVRKGRFGISCTPSFDARKGGPDTWALELAGHAEAASGLAEAMAWADKGSEIFVISQLGYTRGILAAMKDVLPAGSLEAEDQMLLGAQAMLGLNVAEGAVSSLRKGGLSGLMNFGAKQAVSNATTAVTYKVDQAFRPLVRATFQVTFQGAATTRYAARGTPYHPRDREASLRFKRARYQSYEMTRVRPKR